MDELLTTNDAADYLGCSHGHVQKLVTLGRLAVAKRYPKQLLFTRADLDAYASTKKAGGYPIGRPRRAS